MIANNNAPVIAWNGRGNLRSLMAELERQRESRIDFCCDTSMLRLRGTADGGLRLVPAHVQASEWLPSAGVTISDHAIGQIGECATPAVPYKYIRDLGQVNPLAAAALVNSTGTAQRRFIRVLDGRCRAFLSDSYRVMDHYDTTFAALDVAQKVGAKVLECSLTDSHMRLKLVNAAVADRIMDRQENGGGDNEFIRLGQGANPGYRDAVGFAGTGDQVQRGTVHPVVTISNSETGEGGLNVKVGIFEAYCLNTSLVDTAVRQIHLGRKMEEGVRYQRDTQQADATAMGLKIRDVLTQAFNAEGFAELCGRVRAANEVTVASPSAAIGQLVDAGLIPENRKDALLEHFLGRGNKTAWGVAQGLTRLAQDTADPAEAAELELLAGKVIASPKLVLA